MATVICSNCGAHVQLPEHSMTCVGTSISRETEGTFILPTEEKENMPMTTAAVMTKNEERLEALKAAGINTDKYFNVKLPSGGEVIMRLKDGCPVAVSEDELKIRENIIEDGYVRNSMLHRRFVMAQMFRMLGEGYDKALKRHGYMYQFTMTLEELRVQSILFDKDEDTFNDRNSFFDKRVAVALIEAYAKDLEEYLRKLKVKHCKGIPYITWKGTNVFVEDINNKIIRKFNSVSYHVKNSRTPSELYREFNKVVNFIKNNKIPTTTNQSKVWVDAYKGAGAYYTLRNMVQFHDCFIEDYKTKAKYEGVEAVKYLEKCTKEYKGEGWRFMSMLKKCIADNNFKFTC